MPEGEGGDEAAESASGDDSEALLSAPVDWLIVGLGNPGPRYAQTPHNVGFLIAEALAPRWDLPRQREVPRLSYAEGRAGPGGPRVALLMPQTYMNEAGRSAGPARGAFKLDSTACSSCTTRSTCRSATSRAPRRRARRPQRAEVPQSRARRAGLPRVRIGVGRPDSTDPEIVSAHVLGKWRQSADEVRALVEHARDEAERLVLSPPE